MEYVILWHIAEHSAIGVEIAVQVIAVELDTTFRGRDVTSTHIGQCTHAGTTSTDEGHKFARRNRERYIVEDHPCFPTEPYRSVDPTRIDSQRAALVVLIKTVTVVDQF